MTEQQQLHFRLLLTESYSLSCKGFLPTAVDILVIWVKFAPSHPLSPLITKMLMFNLAISCFTTSKFPWSTDLTFQVPTQCCSSQHRTVLPPRDTSTAASLPLRPGCFFLPALLTTALCSSPEHTGPRPRGARLPVPCLFAFSCLLGFSGQRWSGLRFPPPGDTVTRAVHYDPPVPGGPAQHGPQLHWVTQALLRWQSCRPRRGAN